MLSGRSLSAAPTKGKGPRRTSSGTDAGRGRIASGPQVRALGLPTEDEDHLDDVLDELADEAEGALKRLKGDALELDDTIETAITRAVKKASQRIWGRRPVVETTVLRV